MSINTIIKSDGTRVPFDPNKLNKWGEYASANDVPWSDITLTAYKKCYDGCSTKDIHQAMIDACVEKEDEKHLKMAGRLLIGAIYKEAHGGFKSIPTLKDFYHSMVERGLWAEMDYTDEELDKLESVIDHSKNMSKNYSYTALKQMRDKYLIQDLVKRVCYESPQFMFMGVALQGYEKQPKDRRLQDISELYTYLSDLKINVSTPMLVNLRTPKKGLASCCVYTTNDTAESLASGDHIAYMMTCASAGIGSHLTTRSKGDPIRNGAVVHQGKLPYLRMIQSAVHANKQACYDEQTEVLTSSGFKFFKDLKEDDLVAQVHNDGTIDFVIPEDYFVYDVDGELVSFKRDNKDEILVTDNHTMVYQEDDVIDEDNFDEEKLDYDSLFKTCEAGEFETSTSRRFKNSGEIVNKDSSDIDFEDMLATLLLFKQEYKFIENDKTFVGIDISSDSKNNILDFIQNLFKKTGREFYVSESIKDEDIGDSRTIMFDMTNDEYKSIMNRCGTILERLGAPMLRDLLDFIKWIHNDDIVDLNKEQQDYILAIASLSNVTVNIRTIVSEDEEISDKLVVDILPGAPTFIPTSEFTKSLKKYKGKVYCVEVPTNKLIIKRGTETLVCGNSRGGANTTYFSVLDPEINDLIVLKNPTTVLQKRIRDIDYALNVNKLFVEKVAKNEDWYTLSYYHAPDLHDAFYSEDYELFKSLYEKYKDNEHATKYKARDIAVKALTESVETGRLYIHYVDEANRHTPFAVGSGANDDKIYSSNLCIAGDQMVATDRGILTAEELFNLNKELVTYDGEQFNNTSVMKLREKNVPTYKITLSNGMSHTVTDYHEIMTDRGLVACKDLDVGIDRAKINRGEGIFGSRSDMKDEALLLGLYEGDGTQHTKPNGDKYIHLDLYSNKTMEIRDYVQEVYDRVHIKHMKDGVKVDVPNRGEYIRHYDIPRFHDRNFYDTYSKCRLTSRMLSSKLNFEKGVIPKWLRESNKETQVEYIKGIFYTDGSYSFNEKSRVHHLSLKSIDKEWLEMVQSMLNNMGVTMGLYIGQKAGGRMLPDGNGGSKIYECKDVWRLVCSSKNDIIRFNNLTKFLEFRGKEQCIADGENNVSPPRFNKIVSIEYVGDQDVYCPTVYSDEHLFVSNCFITKNCLEINLPTKGFTGMKDLYGEDPEGEIGLCSLSSIVVGRVTEEEYENVAYHVAMFVDNTIDIMDFPFDSLKYTAQARRSIGIGITNLAYDIANKGLSYTTKEGKEYIHKIAERHAYYLYKASARLGKEKGIADWMYKTKYPTGWLPIDTYNRNVDDVVDNKLTYDWEGLRNEIVGLGGIRNSTVVAIPPNESSSLLTNTTNSIYPVRSLKVIKTSGTNRNILLAPDYERLARKYDIAWNVSTKDLIELYAIVQKFTDQGISADLYVSYKDSQLVSSRTLLTDFIMMMRLGCKSRYYINSQSGVDADYFNKENAEIIDADAFCDSCVL